MTMKLMVVGHGRHGKDTVGELLLVKYGLSFTSSSLICAESVVLPRMKERGFEYKNAMECFYDRHNHRSVWHEIITEYAERNGLEALSREIFRKADVYCGCRSDREFFAAKAAGLFDFSVWVDRSKHLPDEPRESMKLEKWMCDQVLDNNDTLERLEKNLDSLMSNLRRKYDSMWPYERAAL